MIILLYGFIIIGLWFDFNAIIKQFNQVQSHINEHDLLFMAKKLNIKQVVLSRYLIIVSVFIGTYLTSKNILLALIMATISYFIYYQFVKMRYTKLLKLTNIKFPYYLNNLAILIQQNPIVNALYKSIDYAPDIFKDDLYLLVSAIHESPESIEPYLIFAHKYKSIDDIQRIMRSLYNLSKKVENKEDSIVSISRLCNEKLAVQFEEDLKNKLDRQMIIPYVLFIWLGIIMIQMIATIQLF